MSQLYYLYGIVNSESKNAAVAHNGLAVIYDHVSEDEFGQEVISEHLKNMEWVNEKVMIHQNKLEEIAQTQTVVPLKFGSIFKTEESIKQMLKERNDQFKGLLEKFEGKKEYGIKLFYQQDQLNSWLDAHSELQSTNRQMASVSDGSAFLLKKKKEELQKKLNKELLNETRQNVYQFISSIAQDILVSKEVDQSLSGRPEKNFLNLALLIDADSLRSLKEFVQKEADALSEKGMLMELSGPWPPYSFVNNG